MIFYFYNSLYYLCIIQRIHNLMHHIFVQFLYLHMTFYHLKQQSPHHPHWHARHCTGYPAAENPCRADNVDIALFYGPTAPRKQLQLIIDFNYKACKGKNQCSFFEYYWNLLTLLPFLYLHKEDQIVCHQA